MRRAGAFTAVVLMAAALSACGGSDAAPPPPGSADNPIRATAQDTSAPRSNEAAAPAKSEAAPGYKALVEEQAKDPAKRFTPCNLVTQAQARKITGERVKPPIEAPQGPTCIYQTKRGRLFTLAVQSADFDTFRRGIGGREPISIDGSTAYCGVAGQPTLALRLSRGRVLTVAAPCQMAREFARTAVRRLNS